MQPLSKFGLVAEAQGRRIGHHPRHPTRDPPRPSLREGEPPSGSRCLLLLLLLLFQCSWPLRGYAGILSAPDPVPALSQALGIGRKGGGATQSIAHTSDWTLLHSTVGAGLFCVLRVPPVEGGLQKCVLMGRGRRPLFLSGLARNGMREQSLSCFAHSFLPALLYSAHIRGGYSGGGSPPASPPLPPDDEMTITKFSLAETPIRAPPPQDTRQCTAQGMIA